MLQFRYALYRAHPQIQRMQSGSGEHSGKDKDLGMRCTYISAHYMCMICNMLPFQLQCPRCPTSSPHCLYYTQVEDLQPPPAAG